MILRKEVDMVNIVPFDTLAYAKKLEARGVEVKQAEAHAEVLAEVLEVSFPTKQEFISTFDKFSAEIRHEMNARFGEIRHEMDARFHMMDAKFNEKFNEFKFDIIKWMIGICLTQSALTISAMKFFH